MTFNECAQLTLDDRRADLVARETQVESEFQKKEMKAMVVDPEMVLATAMQAVQQQAKIFGPIYPKLVGRYLARFVGDRLSEIPPKVESMEEAVEYVRSNLERFPKGYAGIPYAVDKAFSMLEGNVGAGAKMLVKPIMKKLISGNGVDKVIGAVSGTTDALLKHIKLMEALSIYPEGMMTGIGDESSAVMRMENCHFSEACDKLLKEGIGRQTGGMECFFGTMNAIAVEVLTKSQHDYENIEISPPNCRVKIFKTA